MGKGAATGQGQLGIRPSLPACTEAPVLSLHQSRTQRTQDRGWGTSLLLSPAPPPGSVLALLQGSPRCSGLLCPPPPSGIRWDTAIRPAQLRPGGLGPDAGTAPAYQSFSGGQLRASRPGCSGLDTGAEAGREAASPQAGGPGVHSRHLGREPPTGQPGCRAPHPTPRQDTSRSPNSRPTLTLSRRSDPSNIPGPSKATFARTYAGDSQPCLSPRQVTAQAPAPYPPRSWIQPLALHTAQHRTHKLAD